MSIKESWSCPGSDVGRGDGVASSPCLLWLDTGRSGAGRGQWAVWAIRAPGGRALRGLHGEVETIPVPHLRTQAQGFPGKDLKQ